MFTRAWLMNWAIIGTPHNLSLILLHKEFQSLDVANWTWIIRIWSPRQKIIQFKIFLLDQCEDSTIWTQQESVNCLAPPFSNKSPNVLFRIFSIIIKPLIIHQVRQTHPREQWCPLVKFCLAHVLSFTAIIKEIRRWRGGGRCDCL